MMKVKFLTALALLSVSMTSASAYDSRQLGKKNIDFQQNPIDYPDDYYSNHSMGCMLLQECKEGIVEVTSRKSFENYYGVSLDLGQEFDELLEAINKVGSKVFIAPESYFPVGHRGVYHTVSNNFYLNDRFMNRKHVIMSVMRHEGWHAAQDCMAGTIENNMIAIIKPEEEVPKFWADMATKTYPESALPWEKEATWAGRTEWMTTNALKACATGEMWKVYEPTPLTREYLVKEGYIKE